MSKNVALKTKKEINPALKNLGDCIKVARNKYGISQGNLALKAGLQYPYVGVIERGETNVSFLVLKKIAVSLGLSISEILNGVDMTLE